MIGIKLNKKHRILLLYHKGGGIDNGCQVNYNKTMDKKTKIWILVFVLLCAVGVGAFLLLRGDREGTVAVISVDGEELDRIDLSRVKEPYDIELNTGYGRNLVHVEPGAISVTEADCPDRICVSMGRLQGGGIPIVCMPHHLIITIEGGEIDG